MFHFCLSFFSVISTSTYVAPDPSEVIDITADDDDPITIHISPDRHMYVITWIIFMNGDGIV